jgi:hypothetical protein
LDIKEMDKMAQRYLLGIHYIRASYEDLKEKNQFQDGVNLNHRDRKYDMNTKALCNYVDELESLGKWIEVIELVEKALSERYNNFLRIWRESHHQIGQICPNSYIAFQYNKWFFERFHKEISIHPSTIRKIKSSLIDVTVRIALQKGLIEEVISK